MVVLHDRIFVVLESSKGEMTTAGGIIIQESSFKDTDKALNRSEVAKVLQVGTKIKEKELKVGSKVHLLGKAGHSIEIEGVQGVLVRESEILAIIT